ncbi:MAG: hypothetical protein F7B17_08410 [Desulfurococcales archaeon]|nr:hypothetical protein [Desulfurococcales archaeon]
MPSRDRELLRILAAIEKARGKKEEFLKLSAQAAAKHHKEVERIRRNYARGKLSLDEAVDLLRKLAES